MSCCAAHLKSDSVLLKKPHYWKNLQGEQTNKQTKRFPLRLPKCEQTTGKNLCFLPKERKLADASIYRRFSNRLRSSGFTYVNRSKYAWKKTRLYKPTKYWCVKSNVYRVQILLADVHRAEVSRLISTAQSELWKTSWDLKTICVKEELP